MAKRNTRSAKKTTAKDQEQPSACLIHEEDAFVAEEEQAQATAAGQDQSQESEHSGDQAAAPGEEAEEGHNGNDAEDQQVPVTPTMVMESAVAMNDNVMGQHVMAGTPNDDPLEAGSTSAALTGSASDPLMLPPGVLPPPESVSSFPDLYNHDRFRFSSFQDAFDYGKLVAKQCGFQIRVKTTGSNLRLGAVYKYVVCTRQGWARDSCKKPKSQVQPAAESNEGEHVDALATFAATAEEAAGGPMREQDILDARQSPYNRLKGTGSRSVRCGCPWKARIVGWAGNRCAEILNAGKNRSAHHNQPSTSNVVSANNEPEIWLWLGAEKRKHHNHDMDEPEAPSQFQFCPDPLMSTSSAAKAIPMNMAYAALMSGATPTAATGYVQTSFGLSPPASTMGSEGERSAEKDKQQASSSSFPNARDIPTPQPTDADSATDPATYLPKSGSTQGLTFVQHTASSFAQSQQQQMMANAAANSSFFLSPQQAQMWMTNPASYAQSMSMYGMQSYYGHPTPPLHGQPFPIQPTASTSKDPAAPLQSSEELVPTMEEQKADSSVEESTTEA